MSPNGEHPVTELAILGYTAQDLHRKCGDTKMQVAIQWTSIMLD